jgi:hypothetical protein
MHLCFYDFKTTYDWALWWTKRHWGRFFPSTSVSLANHSTNFSINIITLAKYAYWWPQCRVDPIGLHPPLHQLKKNMIERVGVVHSYSGKCSIQISVGAPVILRFFRGSLQSLQAKSEKYLRYGHFLPNLCNLLLTNHPTIRRYSKQMGEAYWQIRKINHKKLLIFRKGNLFWRIAIKELVLFAESGWIFNNKVTVTCYIS